MLFPQTQIDEVQTQTGRDLIRFDLDFVMPDHFLPEFPPAMYLTTRPDLGDVSQGQLVTSDNYYELFNEILNPKQLDGLRLLLTPFPQQQFNATTDRRSLRPSLGVACFDCHANGHQFALGGEIDESAAGWFVPVSLVDNPPEDSRIVREEPFGPILPLLKWSDEDDVIARANDTIYGLGASVWGRDLEAVERIGSQLEAGTVWLNEVHQYSPFQAFGGHKQSGLGCENSLHGLMEYTNWQTITLKKNEN